MPVPPGQRQEAVGCSPARPAATQEHTATPPGALGPGPGRRPGRERAAACTVCGRDPGRRGPRRDRCDRCYQRIRRNGHLSTFTLARPPRAAFLWSPPPAWTTRALCSEVDPDLWYPDHYSARECRAAIAICAGCPVRADCLEYALAIGEVNEGIWGGLTPTQRQAEQRRRAAATPRGSQAA
jgi:WhiB family redox-sensing transcriptional regulator